MNLFHVPLTSRLIDNIPSIPQNIGGRRWENVLKDHSCGRSTDDPTMTRVGRGERLPAVCALSAKNSDNTLLHTVLSISPFKSILKTKNAIKDFHSGEA